MRKRFWLVLFAISVLLVNPGLRARTTRPTHPAEDVHAAYGVISSVLPHINRVIN